MGILLDAFKDAEAKAAAKRKEAPADGDVAELVRRVAAAAIKPKIYYKPRAAGTVVQRDKHETLSVKASPTEVPAVKTPQRKARKRARTNGRAIDRRMRLARLKGQAGKQKPLVESLAVYGGQQSVARQPIDQGGGGVSSKAQSVSRIGPDARVLRPPAAPAKVLWDRAIEDHGVALEHIAGTPAAPRELVLGLDFGSSSTKLVISDRAAGKSFAVAVADGSGIGRYLLPTTIRHHDGVYSLDGDGALYTGLKSDLLASPGDPQAQERAVAYLALAIRRARGWLFEFHSAIYRNVPIVWSLTLGIPKRQGQIDRDTRLYSKLAAVAWHLAGRSGQICGTNIAEALRCSSSVADDSVEIRVVPEIAAEIYGFVSSESFDPKGHNNFLMVDVGGKTLDASLFHAKRGKGNRWGFSFFTSVVQPLGAIELHGERIQWWQLLLRQKADDECATRLIADLEAWNQTGSLDEVVPDSASDYVAGVQLMPGVESGSPDGAYRTQVRTAVRRKAYDRAVGAHLSVQQMDHVEYFLCGGGSRMALYSKMVHAVLGGASGSLFYAKRRTLQVPADLEAPTLLESEYDRLAVAYGLSHLDGASVIDPNPLPVTRRAGKRYEDRFISQDMC